MWGGDHLRGAAALHVAASQGNITWITEYLDHHPQDIERRDTEGWTPLAWAASKGNLQLSRLLLGKGAEVDGRNRWGCTPLFIACVEGHAEMVRVLRAAGADSSVCTEAEGVNALMEASWHGHTDVVRLLLPHPHHVDINRRDVFGRTALWRACYSGFFDVAQILLLECRADFWIPGSGGRPPLQIVQEKGNHLCERLLQEAERTYMLVKARQICTLQTRMQRPAAIPAFLIHRMESPTVPMPELRISDGDETIGEMAHSMVPRGFLVPAEEQKGRDQSSTVGQAASMRERRIAARLTATLGYMLECAPIELFMELEDLLGFTSPIHKDELRCGGSSESDDMSL